MMRQLHTPFGRPSERGAALVAALMFVLVLTGLGLVAMQSTVRSLQVAGNFRMRKQAQAASDGGVMYVSTRAGARAAAYWQRIERAGTGPDAALSARTDAVTLGGYAKLLPSDFNLNTNSGNATGLFTSTAGVSHESAVNGASFEAIVRDPVEGPPAPGYSGKFCFKKVFFASRVTYGTNELLNNDEWDRPVASAMGQTGVEGLIGPIECGNN